MLINYNYTRIAWRNMKENKMFSFINVFGLSINLTSCLLIGFYNSNSSNTTSLQRPGFKRKSIGIPG